MMPASGRCLRNGMPIAIAWPEDWALTDSRLGAYEKCPRRFFYTHVLGLGGARNPTAFSRTHDCLYKSLSPLARRRPPDVDATLAEVEAAFEAIWAQRGRRAAPPSPPIIDGWRVVSWRR